LSSFAFTKVTIIESLDSKEFKSGTELCKFIRGLKVAHPSVPEPELIEVGGSVEFLNAIKTLTEEAKRSDESPIVQIEMHGWDDKTGLAFPDDTSLSWHELAAVLGDLNRATAFNLVVCVAACFGGHFIGALRPVEPSPCFAMIGPTNTMSGQELLDSFSAFYRELLTGLEANAALTALHNHRVCQGGFLTTTAEDWFFKLADGYLQTHCTPERLRVRGDSIVDEIHPDGKGLNPALQERIAHIGEELAFSFLDRRFPSFFMTDAVPENKNRFAKSLGEAKQRAKLFFDSQHQQSK
jgi:hypothetical protein